MTYQSIGRRFRYQISTDIGVGGDPYGILQFNYLEGGFRTVGTFNLSWLPHFRQHAADLRTYLREHTDAVRWASDA